MKIVFVIFLMSALVSGASVLGKFSCKGDFQYYSESRNYSGQCEDISIETRLAADEVLHVTNHYTGCANFLGHFQDREFKIANGVLFEDGFKVGYITKDILYFVEGTPGEWGYKTIMLSTKNGALVYEDHLSYLDQNYRHSGVCN